MLEIILQSFQENNNVINVAADKKFMKSKNHIHHVLSIQKKFLIIHENYTCSLFLMSMLNKSSHQVSQNDEFSSSCDVQCQYLSSDRETEKNLLQVDDNALS